MFTPGSQPPINNDGPSFLRGAIHKHWWFVNQYLRNVVGRPRVAFHTVFARVFIYDTFIHHFTNLYIYI